jgi:putative colanic acid biosynthesis UDP-glucose lipid carrier transferase
MFNKRNYRPTFFSAPESVTSFVAAFLEPFVTVGALLAVMQYLGESMLRPDLALCLLAFALTFPGRNRFHEEPLDAAIDVVSTWAAVLVILTLCGLATNSLMFFKMEVMLVWALVTPVAQWLVVVMGRHIVQRQMARPETRRKAVVVGAGALGLKVAKALQSNPGQPVSFVGYFDDRSGERVHPETEAERLGGLKDIADHVQANGIHEVYITLPLGSQPRIVALMEAIQGTTASLYFVPDVFGISIIQGRLQDMNGVPVVGICETPFTGINELSKRVFDIAVASIILVLIAPILLAVAVGVKLSSPGPVIFKQRRNGLDGEEIIVYKFRSMRAMDNGEVVKQATKGDPRITRFGAFLRKTSLDELPQFINVLQGRMSIVGPRPHAVAHNESYRKLIKAYMVRHKVRPGITGWAQVNGCRGETETLDKMQARVEYDLEYLRNWSVGLDVSIIFRTIRLVLFDRNAY